jgi:hypothetical protein
MREWVMGATGAVVAIVASAPGAWAAGDAVCAIDFDLRTQGLMLRYAGTQLSFDTQDDADGIRVLVDFDGPVAVRAGQSLSACAEFASWRVEGARLVIAFKRPYTLMVQDDPQARVAWLFNASAHRSRPVAAAVAPTPAPVVTAINPPAAEPVPMAVAAWMPGLATRSDAVPGRKPRPDAPAYDTRPRPEPQSEPQPEPETIPAAPARIVVAGRPPLVAGSPDSPIAPPVSLPAALNVAAPVVASVVPAVRPVPPATVPPAAAPAPAVAASPAGPWWSVGPRREGVAIAPALTVAGYAEHYPAGDVSVQTTGVLMPGLSLAARGRAPFASALPDALQDDWFARLRVDTAHYAFRDTLFPLSTHTRQTWRADWQAGRTFSWHQLDMHAGLGYMVRWESTLHSAVAPEPSYAFASGRLLHGPELASGLTWRLPAPDSSAPAWAGIALSGWRLVADGGVSPWVMSRVDGGAGPLPGLLGTRVWLGAERWVGDRCIRVGYQRTGLAGGGQYDETFQGPTLSVQ